MIQFRAHEQARKISIISERSANPAFPAGLSFALRQRYRDMNVLYILMAVISGAGMSVQTAVNSRLSAGIGDQPLMAALISFAVGTLCLGSIAVFQGDWPSVASAIGHQPWWRWVGGILGACVVFAAVTLAPKLGLTNSMFLFIIAQLIAGMVIDSLGLIQMPVRPLYWWKYAGMGVMILGLILFMFGDRWFDHG